MTAEELMIGYSLSKNVSPNIDADEDVFSEAAGTMPRLFQSGGLRARTQERKDSRLQRKMVKKSTKPSVIKAKAKLAEQKGMAKAAQMASMPTNEPIKKDNTMKYVLIGVGGLAVLGLAFYMIKKGKK